MSQLISDRDKKRNLLSRKSDHEEVCLSDLTDFLLKLSPDISKLEFFDNKSSAKRVTGDLRKFKTLIELYYNRMKSVKKDVEKIRSRK